MGLESRGRVLSFDEAFLDIDNELLNESVQIVENNYKVNNEQHQKFTNPPFVQSWTLPNLSYES